MPIREYECPKCELRKEFIELNGDYNLPLCDDCCRLMRRVISAPNFQLKGDGWSHDGYTYGRLGK